MISKEEIQKEIEEMDLWVPVYEIEKRLGMPPTTLQKVLKGTRALPKKWNKKLEAYFLSQEKKLKLDNSIIEVNPKINNKNNSSTETIDPLINKKRINTPNWKEGDPKEATNSFYLKFGAFYYDDENFKR